jgi:hypothetical protein
MMLPHGMAFWFGARLLIPVGVVVVAGVPKVDGAAGVADVDGLGPSDPIVVAKGDGLGGGTTRKGLTPALPISTEPNGIPDRETPLGEMKGVAAIDEGLLLAPVPQTAALPGGDIPAAIPIPPPSYVLVLDIPEDSLAAAGQFVP